MIELLAGAAIALFGQWIVNRARNAYTAKRLALAFYEELSAVAFTDMFVSQGNVAVRRIGGFTSQTFDTLFVAVATTLPRSLTKALMRYHWRMKMLSDFQKKVGHLDSWPTFFDEAKAARNELKPRLKRYEQRHVLGIMNNRNEGGSLFSIPQELRKRLRRGTSQEEENHGNNG